MRFRLKKTLLPVKPEEDFREGDILIEIMSPQEFKELDSALPHRKVLISQMDHIQYCKAEVFGNCIVGTFRIPRKKASFGYYLSRDYLLFVDAGETALLSCKSGRCIRPSWT